MYSSPAIVYRSMVAKKQIVTDASQESAIGHLDSLYHQLQDKSDKKWYQRFLPDFVAGAENDIKGCYLWGGVGTGKTMLMDIFFQCCDPQFAERIHFHRFMRDIHAKKNALKNQPQPLQIIAKDLAQQKRIICLDEFLVTDIADAMILSGLLKAFLDHQIVLITTSNTHPDQLYQGGIQRTQFLPAIDLLNQFMTVVNVDSRQDYRTSYLCNNRLFLSPIDAQTNDNMQNIFKRLSGQSALAGEVVINDRPIKTLGATEKEAWFDFCCLCDTDRARDDFVEIAQQYPIVMISNIITMDDDTRDITRRFIELIDALYDANVNLIASATHPPKELYNGVLLQPSFQRTASRLLEMFSDDYLRKTHRQ